ncbi:UNVERIFIED_CONTAM: hypothetical protein FKN15_070555 [Acipenser sinensis]
MAGVFTVFTALLLCLPYLSDGINVRQSPPSLIESPGHSAELQCSHDDSNYQYMYWYQQTSKGALELIGYLSYTDVKPEEKFMKRFNLTGDARKAGPSQGIGVSQTPQVLLQGSGGSAGMFCRHDGDSTYTQMYWYHQLRGQGIQLLVFSVSGSAPQFEKDFNEERYEVNRSAVNKGSLKIKNLEPDLSDGINVHQSPPSLFESPGCSPELQCSHDASSSQYMYWYQQTNPSEGINIEQSPPVGERPGQSAELECHHDDSSYNYMYWYQQSRGEGAFKQIGYLQLTTPSLEEKFKERFSITGEAAKKGFLTISNLIIEDSTIYYCAASKAQCCRSPLSSTKTLRSHSLPCTYMRARHVTTCFKPLSLSHTVSAYLSKGSVLL